MPSINPKVKLKRISVYCSDGKQHYLKVPIHIYTTLEGKHVNTVDINDLIKAERKAGYAKRV